MVKSVLLFVALINGGWMLFDGAYVLRHGKYFGSDVPGPWRYVVQVLGLDPLKLGPLFLAFGAMWILAGLAMMMGFSRLPLIVISVATLWYIPIGAILSVVTLALVFLTA